MIGPASGGTSREALADRVEALFRIGIGYALAGMAAAVLLVFVARGVPASLLGGWFLLLLVVVLARLALARAWWRLPVAERDPELWARRYTLGSLAAGLVWGFGVDMMLELALPADRASILVTSGAVLLGAVGSGLWMPACLAFILGYVVPILLWALWRETLTDAALALVGTGALALAAGRTVGRRAAQLLAERRRNRHLIADLEAAKSAAERALAERSAFLATISHEVRTPLTGILGMVRLMLDDSQPGERIAGRQRDRLETVERASRALKVLLDDVLDLSKFEAGRLEIEPEPVDLTALVRDVTALLTGLAEHKGLSLTAHVDERVPRWVECDGLRLSQVLNNLVTNAIKFTDSGWVTLTVAAQAGGEGGLPRLGFTVADSGIGFDGAEPRPASGRPASGREGAGLGLVISAGIVTAMGGRLEHAPRPGGGTVVSFSLPLRAAPQEPGTAPVPAGRALTLMVVDDDPLALAVAEGVLREAGHRAVLAASAEGAVARLAELRPDAILVDQNLPGHAPAAVLHALAEAAPGVPLVVLSADPPKRAPAGTEGVLAKPIDPLALARLLALASPGPARPSAQLERLRDALAPEDLAALLAESERQLRARAAEVAALLARRTPDPALLPSLRQLAHDMRGMAANVGLEALAAAAGRVAAAADAGDAASAARLAAQLPQMLDDQTRLLAAATAA